MFKFDKEQIVVEVGNVKLGGQPGQFPTVLIGSIFYERHKIVKDPKTGRFDETEAETLIKTQEELSDKTGNPHIVDVVGSTSTALIKYIDFVSKITQNPFLVDGPSSTVRLEAIKHCRDIGLMNRAIYNSIDENVKPEEVEAIHDLGVQSAVILAFNSRDPRVRGRISVLKRLLEVAQNAEISNLIVDTAVLDAPSIGTSARTVHVVKSEYGLPAGCAPSNAIYTWKELQALGEHASTTGIAASHVFPVALGADFVLYGPMRYANIIFPACATVDAFIGYDSRWRGIKPERSHPLYRIF